MVFRSAAVTAGSAAHTARRDSRPRPRLPSARLERNRLQSVTRDTSRIGRGYSRTARRLLARGVGRRSTKENERCATTSRRHKPRAAARAQGGPLTAPDRAPRKRTRGARGGAARPRGLHQARFLPSNGHLCTRAALLPRSGPPGAAATRREGRLRQKRPICARAARAACCPCGAPRAGAARDWRGAA